MSYLHASPAPASRPLAVERDVAAPRPAQRAADAERRHQLHRHGPQPAAGKAQTSASCLPTPIPTSPAGGALPGHPGLPRVPVPARQRLRTAELHGFGAGDASGPCEGSTQPTPDPRTASLTSCGRG